MGTAHIPQVPEKQIWSNGFEEKPSRYWLIFMRIAVHDQAAAQFLSFSGLSFYGA